MNIYRIGLRIGFGGAAQALVWEWIEDLVHEMVPD